VSKKLEDPVYVDSSVFVAILASGDRHHSSAVRFLRVQGGPLVTSCVSEVELGRALRRRAAPRAVHLAARELLDYCEIVDLTPEIRQQAIEVIPASVRSLDAMHLATALIGGIKGFASFDARQRVAAEEMGLKLAFGS